MAICITHTDRYAGAPVPYVASHAPNATSRSGCGLRPTCGPRHWKVRLWWVDQPIPRSTTLRPLRDRNLVPRLAQSTDRRSSGMGQPAQLGAQHHYIGTRLGLQSLISWSFLLGGLFPLAAALGVLVLRNPSIVFSLYPSGTIRLY